MPVSLSVLMLTVLAASAGPRKGEMVAKDSGKQQGEDLELTPEKARDVKGGVVPPGDGGSPGRHVAVKKHTHKKGVGPIQKLPHA
jgi:hypothetical protein